MSFGNLKHSLSLQPVIFPGQSTVRWNDGTMERWNDRTTKRWKDPQPRRESIAPYPYLCPVLQHICPRTYTTPKKKEEEKKKEKERSKKEKNGDKVASAFPITLRVNLAGWKAGNVAIHATRTRLAPIVSTSPPLSPPLI